VRSTFVALLALCSLLVLGASDTERWAFYPPRLLNRVDVAQLPECSGLVASRHYANRLYAINDHGNPHLVHALDTLGYHQGAFGRAGMHPQDCEEVAMLYGAERDSLLVADLGDNQYGDHAVRPFQRLYRLPEPEWMQNPGRDSSLLDSLRYTYADGPRDAEALLPDPLTREILIISKRDNPSRIYSLRPDWNANPRVLVARQVGTVPTTWVVGASVRPPDATGSRAVLVRTLRKVMLYTVRPGEPLSEALKRAPQVFDAPDEADEDQGESIAWAPDGQGYYTLSEANEKQPRPRLIRTERRR
jgi:hypothetical protein